jgi:hypothetical protein
VNSSTTPRPSAAGASARRLTRYAQQAAEVRERRRASAPFDGAQHLCLPIEVQRRLTVERVRFAQRIRNVDDLVEKRCGFDVVRR